MNVTQIYQLMNTVTAEVLGQTDLVTEDLSNVIDIGTQLFNANAVDNYVKSLVDHIGKVIFVNRPYMGRAPRVLMDSWEYGSVVEKIQADMPEATENESWELVDKQSYDPNIFYKPSVSATFFNGRVTFEVPISITRKQVRESFDNATQLNAFISMIYAAVEKSMTVKLDSLVMRTINNFIGEKLAAKNGIVDLLAMYNAQYKPTTALTAEAAMLDPDFIRFSAYVINLYVSRLGTISTNFNTGGKERFTPRDYMHVVMLENFTSAADVFLRSDVYHNDLVTLPYFDTVPFWQGPGKNYSTEDVSAIYLKTASGATVGQNYIIGALFDRDALGVSCLDRRITTDWNAKAEFWNQWSKMDAGYFNDLNENGVVFVVGVAAEPLTPPAPETEPASLFSEKNRKKV